MGHLIAVLSFPKNAYIPIQSAGKKFNPPEAQIAFHPRPGLAFHLNRGFVLPETVSQKLETRQFSSIVFGKNTVWLKEEADREDYIWIVDNVVNFIPTSRVPDRFLNPSSFVQYLILMSLTTRICDAFLRLCKGEDPDDRGSIEDRSEIEDWHDITEGPIPTADSSMEIADSTPEFKDPKVVVMDREPEVNLLKMVKITPGAKSVSLFSSGAFLNPFDPLDDSDTLSAGHPSQIIAHGKIFKFHPGLALSDANLIGDVIGKRFISCLGDTTDAQFENLQELKSGLSALRLLPIGDVLAHLYKCLDIAMDCHSGCAPFFSNRVYEGCVLMGGVGATLSYNGETVEFESMDDLKREFSTASSHAAALSSIGSKFPLDKRGKVMESQTMYDLRRECLTLSCSQDTRDFILQEATRLEFGLQHWVISPAKLKAFFHLISDFSNNLSSEEPIGRLSLFSKDPLRVALTCFGEKSCPSWDIPNGTRVSLLTANPPRAPANKPGKSPGGVTSDAAWVMPIRTTDLISAEEEFRRIAEMKCFRSISTVLAKRQRMRVFSADRMSVFWSEMQDAVRHINPSAIVGERGISPGKRGRVESAEGPVGLDTKRTKLDF